MSTGMSISFRHLKPLLDNHKLKYNVVDFDTGNRKVKFVEVYPSLTVKTQEEKDHILIDIVRKANIHALTARTKDGEDIWIFTVGDS